MEISEIRRKAPWKNKGDWEFVTVSIREADRVLGHKLEPMRQIALNINRCYEEIDGPAEEICKMTCPACADICCVRATLWYDFKDLLYIYFNTGSFPEKQIFKVKHGTRGACCNLKESGCALSRSIRPFVCTWYFCPDQKREGADFDTLLDQIKRLRNQLEKTYVEVCSGFTHTAI